MSLASPAVRDDDLAILALDAAMEIDGFLRDKTACLAAARAFVDGLKDYKDQASRNDWTPGFCPDSVAMFETAAAVLSRRCKTVGELDKVTSELIAEFEACLRLDVPGPTLAVMRDFCLSIHGFVILGNR
jgi:hypothetical protein